MTETEILEHVNLKLTTKVSDELVEYMNVLSNNIDNTRGRLKSLENELSEAVKLHQDEVVVEKRVAITNLLEEKLSFKAAQDLSYAIFCDTRHLDPNWWAVNELIGKSTARSIWGFKWSTDDKKAFLDFVNYIKSNDTEFNSLAQKMRISEELSNATKSNFEKCIQNIQMKTDSYMSKELTDTLVNLSSYPCSSQELESLFIELLEPITW